MKGVNLGGWLILEKWLTPSLFAGTNAHDEYTLTRLPGSTKIIETHRQTFITEDDFRWLKHHDIELVRIPVGYWLFDSLDGYSPTVSYLDSAMQWARRHGIKVLIDFHGARGSQNGFDNSGKIGKARWFDRPDYQKQSLSVLRRIAERYRNHEALWGIEILNEPKGDKRSYFTLLRFYRQAYRELTALLQPGTVTVFHDAFRPLLFAGALRGSAAYPVMMDSHLYALPLATDSLDSYLKWSRVVRVLLLRYLSLWQPVIVGEWSTVLPQRFFDARPKNEHYELLAQNARMQIDSYRHAASSVYWNYKAEGEGMWNFRSLVDASVISTIK